MMNVVKSSKRSTNLIIGTSTVPLKVHRAISTVTCFGSFQRCHCALCACCTSLCSPLDACHTLANHANPI